MRDLVDSSLTESRSLCALLEPGQWSIGLDCLVSFLGIGKFGRESCRWTYRVAPDLQNRRPWIDQDGRQSQLRGDTGMKEKANKANRADGRNQDSQLSLEKVFSPTLEINKRIHFHQTDLGADTKSCVPERSPWVLSRNN